MYVTEDFLCRPGTTG